MVVVGVLNLFNFQWFCEVVECEGCCVLVLIQCVYDINWLDFEGVIFFGLIVGVFVLEMLVEEIIVVFVERFDVIVEIVCIVEEMILFNLLWELCDLLLQFEIIVG